MLDSNDTGYSEEGRKYLDIKEKTRDKLIKESHLNLLHI
jgi:hypothetical protein